jgi:hypothetical protein
MNEIAQQYGFTWPHESCGSIQLARRLACEMLVSTATCVSGTHESTTRIEETDSGQTASMLWNKEQGAVMTQSMKTCAILEE